MQMATEVFPLGEKVLPILLLLPALGPRPLDLPSLVEFLSGNFSRLSISRLANPRKR